MNPLARLLALLGPGLLIAATGVGAGDLATASLAGSHLGVAVLWAAAAGAVMKFAVTEALARWQLATGTTLLEGVTRHFGRPTTALFLVYLIAWSFFVGSALVSACGVTAHAMWPVFGDAGRGKVLWGLIHSGAGLALVWAGGYRWFDLAMKALVAVMFVTVIGIGVLFLPDAGEVVRGLLVPTIPARDGAVGWTLALIGGVGGTVTVLGYGYWIREEGRSGPGALRSCRIDLAVGYLATGLFGAAMVVIGANVTVGGSGADLLVALADALEARGGAAVRWAFLIGAWSAVFTSVLGVWQAAPYMFADALRLLRQSPAREVRERERTYRGFLIGISVVPCLGLAASFQSLQKIYSMVGALFFPALALALLLLTGRTQWIGVAQRSGPLGLVALLATIAFFAWLSFQGVSAA